MKEQKEQDVTGANYILIFKKSIFDSKLVLYRYMRREGRRNKIEHMPRKTRSYLIKLRTSHCQEFPAELPGNIP